MGGGFTSDQARQMQQQQEQQKAQEEQRKQFLNTLLSPEAKQRLASISLVKPEKARLVEENILRMAQQGMRQQVSEQALISILNQLSQQQKDVKVSFQRRRTGFSDDEDDDNDDDLL